MFLIYGPARILEQAAVKFTKNIFHIEFSKGSVEETLCADQIFSNNFFEGTLKWLLTAAGVVGSSKCTADNWFWFPD